MDVTALRREPPKDRHPSADDYFAPHAGEKRGHTGPASAIDVYLCDITEHAGHQVHQERAHLVRFAAKMLARHAMRGLMHGAEQGEDEEELHQVEQALLREVVEENAVSPDLVPARAQNAAHHAHHHE